jgi:hypothetical protein
LRGGLVAFVKLACTLSDDEIISTCLQGALGSLPTYGAVVGFIVFLRLLTGGVSGKNDIIVPQ